MTRSKPDIRAARSSHGVAIGSFCSPGRPSPCAQPAVMQERPRDRDWRLGMSQQLGAKRQDPGPPDRLPVDNHPSTQVGGSSAFGIDSPAAANVLTEGGHHAQVGCQLLGMKIGRAAANHDQVNAFRQGLVAQRRELDKLGTEGLKRFESVRKITAKCLILRISDSEAPAAVRKAAGTRRANGRRGMSGYGPDCRSRPGRSGEENWPQGRQAVPRKAPRRGLLPPAPYES